VSAIRYEYRTECVDLAVDKFTIRTVCSAYRENALLLRAVSSDSTADETFLRVLDRFQDNGARWIAERIVQVQRQQAWERVAAGIRSLGIGE
jgi:hypothetical protein